MVTSTAGRHDEAGCSREAGVAVDNLLMGPAGIEPATSCLQSPSENGRLRPALSSATNWYQLVPRPLGRRRTALERSHQSP